ncbi:MAG: hypothetical protein BRD50_01935 [Bacteroidetes bacterium SW_11_45_7]|nr:MAG: hypothetical protein BRD50_01935 [Bacteroidetes bacterium SW_11_45_7]
MRLTWNLVMVFLAFIFLSCEKDDRLNATEDQNANDSSSVSSNNNTNSSSDDTDTNSQIDKLGTIEITITNLKSTKGQLLFGLYNKAEDFPEKDRTYAARIVEVESKKVSVQMDSIEPGSYALSVHHDENENDEIDQNFVGIPQEGFGFSNNASATFSPPKFDNAKFQVEKGQKKKLSIKLQHY